jgi:hypothetical protein
MVLCILCTQNYSDAIAREQGQVRSNVGVHRKFSVFNQEDFLHFRNFGVGVARQRFDCRLLLGKELSIYRIIDHGRTSLGFRSRYPNARYRTKVGRYGAALMQGNPFLFGGAQTPERLAHTGEGVAVRACRSTRTDHAPMLA